MDNEIKPEQRRYGRLRDRPDARDLKISFHGDNSSLRIQKDVLPVKYDLRDIMKVPVEMNDIDQGTLGSCVANATAFCGALAQVKAGNDQAFFPSRLFIYYYARYLNGSVNTDSGAQIRDGIKVLAKWGSMAEHNYIYDPTLYRNKPTDANLKEASKFMGLQYYSIDFSHDRTKQDRTLTLKKAVASGYPVVFGFEVFSSFESGTVARTGNVPMPKFYESSIGGHAVAIVGYDDSRKVFIVKNSWGPNWGDKSYFYMPYDYASDPSYASDFWIIQKVSNPTDIPNWKADFIAPKAQHLNVVPSSGGVVNDLSKEDRIKIAEERLAEIEAELNELKRDSEAF